MHFFTVGYGGRKPGDFVRLLADAGVATIVDVRLYPQRASMGSYVKARSPDKGIERLLAAAGIGYLWLPQLGNPFLKQEHWEADYQRQLEGLGDAAFAPLENLPQSFCLMCAEKRVCECHRRFVAEKLVAGHNSVTHLE